MLRPSTAPRWKMAISKRRRGNTAAAARVRKPGANPSDIIARAPDLRNRRREGMGILTGYGLRTTGFRCPPLLPLKLRPADRGAVAGTGEPLRDVHTCHERAGGDPGVGGLVIAGRWLAH